MEKLYKGRKESKNNEMARVKGEKKTAACWVGSLLN